MHSWQIQETEETLNKSYKPAYYGKYSKINHTLLY